MAPKRRDFTPKQKANIEKVKKSLKEAKVFSLIAAGIAVAKKKAPINLVFDQSVADGTLSGNGIDPRTGKPVAKPKPASKKATERKRDRFGRFI
jgi:hypothetical protein